jgi:hypothetical protein
MSVSERLVAEQGRANTYLDEIVECLAWTDGHLRESAIVLTDIVGGRACGAGLGRYERNSTSLRRNDALEKRA